ncbi:MAG TPA: pyruvate kinase [Bryobacteraceae bacterium]|nr:pyruvate kinase [Bryobacteraceae bacterium]
MRSTKIVVTLGPASDSPQCIQKLLENGAGVFRLNASHGTQEEHAMRIERIRAVSAEVRVHACILLDLQGPKIRLGRFESGGCYLKTGSVFTITTEEILGNCERASTNYEAFARDLKPGDFVLLADGSVTLEVLETDGIAARCAVLSGGSIGDRKGINLPGVALSIPSLTEKDILDLDFGVRHGVDFIALSFVRKADDPRCLRAMLDERGAKIPIISKIEKPEAWENLDEILAESDGVMVARGDLGVEMPIEQVPHIQKSMIERARHHGKLVITATQMLESMIANPFPTRAEVSDVANAIYDGSDAVMLSGETSVGKYPAETVTMMARIAAQAESTRHFHVYKDLPPGERCTYAEIIAAAAYQAAGMAGVAAIAVFTSSGLSARLVSRFRPPVPIFAFTPSVIAARRLALSYGVHPLLVPEAHSTELMLAQVDRMVLDRGWLKPGDGVVCMAGQPTGKSGTTNMLKLHRVGDSQPRS